MFALGIPPSRVMKAAAAKDPMPPPTSHAFDFMFMCLAGASVEHTRDQSSSRPIHDVRPAACLCNAEGAIHMGSTPQQLKDKAITDFEAGKKAFHDAKAKAQTHIDAITAEIGKLRADLKTQTADAKSKASARIDELTKDLDAARKEKQDQIEARLKALHTEMASTEAELKHATAERKVAVEAKAKAVREQYESTRKALSASLEADLTELKARINAASDAAAGKKEAAKSALQSKIADLHTRHEAAQKKLHALKEANTTAFDELHRGVRTAVAEVRSAVHHAHKDISAAS